MVEVPSKDDGPAQFVQSFCAHIVARQASMTFARASLHLLAPMLTFRYVEAKLYQIKIIHFFHPENTTIKLVHISLLLLAQVTQVISTNMLDSDQESGPSDCGVLHVESGEAASSSASSEACLRCEESIATDANMSGPGSCAASDASSAFDAVLDIVSEASETESSAANMSPVSDMRCRDDRFKEAFHICYFFVQTASEICGFSNLSKTLLAESGLTFTTHFSGMGCAEVAMRMLVAAVQGSLNSHMSLCGVSVMEKQKRLRTILQERCEEVGETCCCFEDVMDYVPSLAVEDVMSQNNLGDKVKLIRQHLHFGPRLCKAHGVRCPKPRPNGDISGSCCQPWSRCGKKKGWNDCRSILTLIWACVQAELQPDFLCHENVRGFDTTVLDQILGPRYHIWHVRLRPSDFGWRLCSRDRIYSLCVRKTGLRVQRNPEHLLAQITTMCRRHACIELPDVYIASDTELLEAENGRRLRRKLSRLTQTSSCWKYLLTPHQQEYLSKYESLWLSRFNKQASLDPYAIFDLTQNPEQRPCTTTRNQGLPCIRHAGNLLWIPCRGRWLLPIEAAAASGFPVRRAYAMAAGVELDRLSGTSVSVSDIGNGMMTFSMCAVVCALLASVQRVEE